MYNIIFYKNHKDGSEVKLYLKKLQSSNSKSDRIESNKIISYIEKLEEYGLSLTYPFIKPITKDIWELRPLDNRILFAYYVSNQFVILSMFKKKTKKTNGGEEEVTKTPSRSGNTTSTSGNTARVTLPQTGQLWWPVWILAGAGVVLLVIGLIRRKTSR